MPRVNLDPRTGGACVQCMAGKIVSVVVGYVQLVMYSIAFLTLLISPSSIVSVVPDASTAVIVIAGFILLLCITFIIMLLIGLSKGKQTYIKMYCIFMATYTVFIMLSLVVNIFARPSQLGVRGFFSTLFNIIINMVFIFVVRSYYLVTYCNSANQRNVNQPKV